MRVGTSATGPTGPQAVPRSYLGDLERSLELARGLCSSPSLLMGWNAVRILGAAGLLARDESAVDAAAAVAHERLSKVPGTQAAADGATHQRSLLAGGPARVDPEISPENIDPRDPPPAHIVMLLCREAVDAGEAARAVDAARAWAPDAPLGRAVRAAIEATAALDEDRWHEALSVAAEHGLRLVAVDALEGLAGMAATAESWVECLRLAAAAARLRDETGYRWRFAFEQDRLDAAVAAATEALGPERASAANAEGSALEWREAAAYASRARGERQRPSHGWAALDTDGAPGGRARRRRSHEPTGRRATPHGPCHGEDPPRPRVHQDRPPLTDRARH